MHKEKIRFFAKTQKVIIHRLLLKEQLKDCVCSQIFFSMLRKNAINYYIRQLHTWIRMKEPSHQIALVKMNIWRSLVSIILGESGSFKERQAYNLNVRKIPTVKGGRGNKKRLLLGEADRKGCSIARATRSHMPNKWKMQKHLIFCNPASAIPCLWEQEVWVQAWFSPFNKSSRRNAKIRVEILNLTIKTIGKYNYCLLGSWCHLSDFYFNIY